MKNRKAYVVEPRKIEIREEELPAIGDDQVLFKTISIGMCHTDLPTFIGEKGNDFSPKHKIMRMGEGKPSFPVGVGHEPVAECIEVGKNVKNFQVGKIYAGFFPDSYSEYLIADDNFRMFAEVPEGDKPAKYCLGEPLGCITNIVRQASCKYGDNIAVVGCGYMGMMTIAGLRKSGANKLVAVDILDNKLELAKKFGATHVINPAKEAVDDAAYDLTDGNFFDVVVEITGSLRGLDTACKIIKSPHEKGMDHFDGTFRGHGKVLIPSVYAGQETFPTGLAFNLMLRTPILHSTHPTYDTRPRENMIEGMLSYMDGRLPCDEMVTHEFSFDDVQKAFETLAKPPADYVKGIVTF